jgi:hypothetical protein
MPTHSIKNLSVHYDLWGESPVHALGEIGRSEFQFRASGGEWQLEVAGYHGLPSNGDHTGYLYNGTYPGSSVSHHEAASIIESCLRKHVEITD